MTKLSMILEELRRKKGELEAWTQVFEYLSRYLDHDVDEANERLRTEEGVVQQDVIQSVIDRIEDEMIEPLRRDIREIGNLEVAHVAKGNSSKEDSGKKKSPSRKKAASPVKKAAKSVRSAGRTISIRRKSEHGEDG